MPKLKANAGDVDQLEHLRLATARLRELAAAVGPELAGADWQHRREIIRTLVRRIDIDTEAIKIIFRETQNIRSSDSDSIAITLPRTQNGLDCQRCDWL
jgi:site-specific DNA recombinase